MPRPKKGRVVAKRSYNPLSGGQLIGQACRWQVEHMERSRIRGVLVKWTTASLTRLCRGCGKLASSLGSLQPCRWSYANAVGTGDDDFVEETKALGRVPNVLLPAGEFACESHELLTIHEGGQRDGKLR
jgi:hypothetical protein